MVDYLTTREKIEYALDTLELLKRDGNIGPANYVIIREALRAGWYDTLDGWELGSIEARAVPPWEEARA